QKNALLKEYPNMRWHQYDPLGSDNAKAGIKLAFGDDVTLVPIYQFDAAKVIVSLDDNFLADHPGSLAYARQFANGRRVRHDRLEMNRLYVAESAPSITGAMADARLRVLPSEIDEIARPLAAAVGAVGSGKPQGEFAEWINLVDGD